MLCCCCRPLRQAVENYRNQEELPREVRLWSSATLISVAVGPPGGILFRLRLAADEAEAEDLDVAGGKALINGSLLLLSDDHFKTVRNILTSAAQQQPSSTAAAAQQQHSHPITPSLLPPTHRCDAQASIAERPRGSLVTDPCM